MTISIEWIDSGREPECATDPEYPEGKAIICAERPGGKYCSVDLPYPAKRIGLYAIKCSVCGHRVGVTTAGRPDDPRSVLLACGETLQ